MNRQPWNDAEKARMAELLHAGKTLQEIADDLGRTRMSVTNFRKKNPELKAIGVTRIASDGWTAEDREQVAQYLRAGMSAAEIGAKFDVSRNAVTVLVFRDPALKAIGFIRRPGQRGPSKAATKTNVVRLAPPPRANATGAAKPLTPIAAPASPTLRLRVVNDIPAMVEEWLAQNGARKFGKGESADHQSIRFFLQDRGYVLAGWQGKFRISKGAGRPKVMTWRAVLEFVDDIRLAEGLEPILGRAA